MRDVLRAEEWFVVQGKEHQVDLKLGDCQLDYHIRSDQKLSVYISFGDKVLPIGNGYEIQGRLFIADIKWMLIKAEKAGTIACSIFQRERTIVDKLSDKPLAVFVPEAPKVDLRAMVERVVGERLEEHYGPGQQEVSLEEFYDDELADGEEEFGPGFMEIDEATADEFDRRARADRERRAEQEKRRKATEEPTSDDDEKPAARRAGAGRRRKSVRPAPAEVDDADTDE